jgi:CheY-like chemotaxis protein
MIALTADVIPDHIRKFVNAGADAVVAKPVDWNQLDAKIQELTAIRLAARAS